MAAPDCPAPACPYASEMGAHGEAIETLKLRLGSMEEKMDLLVARSEQQHGMIRLALWIWTGLGTLAGMLFGHWIDRGGH